MVDSGYPPVTARTLISETLARVSDSREVSGIVLVVLVVGNAASDYMGASVADGVETALVAPLVKLAVAILGIVAGYLLIEDMARKAGQLKADLDRRYLGYVGQSILIVLGVAGGAILLIVPGVILATRWAMAAPLLVARGEGAIDAIGHSWRATSGHAMAIFLAAAALFIPLLVVLVGALAWDESGLPSLIVQNLAATAMSILSAALGVGALRLINPDVGDMEQVFA